MELLKEFVVGDYYNICCRDCEVSLNFGKKIAKGERLVLQGMFSEQEMKWVDEGRVWLALQAFLQKHEGHALIFDSDAKFPEMQFYERQMFDEL